MSTDKNLEKIIQEAVGNVLASTVKIQKPVKEIIKTVKNIISEAVILMPRSFVLKTDVQSPTTKENHEKLYKSYVDSFNKISSKLDSVSKQDAENPNDSEFRRLKIDENHNMNGAKFHELYFMNIGDLNSEIRADSIPFMRLSRDWGTFDQWQLDFRACGMAATEGWAICYFDPFKQRYFNCFVEKHNMYIPLMGIPVIVIDTWHHAWFYDYPGEKMEYLNKSMRELNWDVIEMRMLASEMSKLNQIYAIQPVISNKKEDRGITLGSNTPPLEVTAGKI